MNKSEIAVLNIELAANKKGYFVSLPKNQASKYDIIIDFGAKLSRCQVKYLNKKKGNILDLILEDKRYKHKKCYTDAEIDLLLIWIPETNDILCLEPKDFHNKKRLYFNMKDEKAWNYYKKYIW